MVAVSFSVFPLAGASLAPKEPQRCSQAFPCEGRGPLVSRSSRFETVGRGGGGREGREGRVGGEEREGGWEGVRERGRKRGWERGNESGRKVKYMYKRRVGQKESS